MPVSDQGIERKRYVVVPRTLIFIFNSNQEVLLIKGAPDKRLWPGLYNGIGGHVEKGEDILSAACRELLEETGLQDIPLQLRGQVMVDVSFEKGVAIFVFSGQADSEITIKTAMAEGELAWVPLKEIDRYPLVEDLPIILARIDHLQEEPCQVFFAHYSYNDAGRLEISIR